MSPLLLGGKKKDANNNKKDTWSTGAPINKIYQVPGKDSCPLSTTF